MAPGAWLTAGAARACGEWRQHSWRDVSRWAVTLDRTLEGTGGTA